MLALLLTRSALGLERLLDLLPSRLGHQWFVVAWVGDALVANETLVIGVCEQAMEVREAQRLARRLRAGRGVEASFGQLGQEVTEVDAALGVLLEGVLHQRATYWIDLHGADLLAVLDPADVEVASWGLADGATSLGLLKRSLLDFVGEVG
ncbi:MAG: hypothetical protein R2710_21835 [Acidimicrobiales bacterium]